MIKNERQFRITRAQADEFRVALSKLEERPAPERASNMADFMSNLASVKETMKTIRTLKAMRAAFGTDQS